MPDLPDIPPPPAPPESDDPREPVRMPRRRPRRSRAKMRLISKLAEDSMRLSSVLENLAATQAGLADVLTGRARQLRKRVRESDQKVGELTRAVRGLEGSIHTLQRDNADLREQLTERERHADRIRGEVRRLEDGRTGDAERSADDQRRRFFAALGQMPVQLPTVRRAVEAGAPVTGRDILGLLRPLDAALAGMGFVPIGTVGEVLTYDETLHQPAGDAERAPTAGERVRIAFVGWRYRDEILRKAQVAPEQG